MFEAHARTIRATSLVPSSPEEPSIADLIQRAEASWLPPALSSEFDLYRMGLAAFHEVVRWRHRPAAWAKAYQIAATAINDSAAHDAGWTSMVFAEFTTFLDQTLASIEIARTKLDEIKDGTADHLSSQKLCDTYLDLFEGVFPPIARALIALQNTRSPKRNSAVELASKTARELYEQLGQRLKSILAPFNPNYRNKIAHRSTTIKINGTVSMPADDNTHQLLSWGHLNEIANDAITALDAFLAALELSPHRSYINFAKTSILAAECVGFACVPLEQQIERWDGEKVRIVEFDLRGPKCDEVRLLRALASAFKAIQPAPALITIHFLNRAGEKRGQWSIRSEVLAAADAPIESIKRTIGKFKCVQLRFEPPFKKV